MATIWLKSVHSALVWVVVAGYSHSSFRAAAENRFIIVVAGSHDFFNSNIIIPSRQVLWHCFDNIGKTWTYTYERAVKFLFSSPVATLFTAR